MSKVFMEQIISVLIRAGIGLASRQPPDAFSLTVWRYLLDFFRRMCDKQVHHQHAALNYLGTDISIM